MNKSESIVELAKALSVFQGQLTPAKKDTLNPFYKHKYADLSSVWEVCREPLAKNGLSIIQLPSMVENNIILETILLHISGEWITSTLQLTPAKSDPQSIGSAITYARRYSMGAILGVATEEDDDAESAMGREPIPKAVITKPSGVPIAITYQPREIKEALAKLDSGLIEKEVKVTEPPTELPDFKDGVALGNYAIKHGWTLPKMKTALGIYNVIEIKDVNAAVAVLFPNAKPKVGTLVEEGIKLGAVVE